MIQEIKKQLLENPENICTLLEEFDFAHITLKRNEIRFARNSYGGPNIRIRLNDEYLNVTDYVNSIHTDIISYIIKEKHTDFRSVLSAIKRILNLSDDWRPQSRRLIFGGVYEHIIHMADSSPKTYDESILDEYLKVPNERFQRDNISLEAQMKFGIGYDVGTDRITIPIRDQHGSLMGIKGRRNYETDNEEDPKYLYLVPCQMSKTLFGYSTNYSSMYGRTVMIFESEKSVLQCASYGYHNAVALGSNSLSEYQAKMILSLNPQKVIFMLDSDLPLENTKRNIDMLRSVAIMRDLQINYFDWTECLELPAKASPSDEGKEVFEYILAENIKDESYLEDEI